MRAGLSSQDVVQRRANFGENRLPEERVSSPWVIVWSQLTSPLIGVIAVGAGISLVLGERSDFLVITAVVLVDVALGFVQEYRAQRSYLALKNLVKPTATVIREGARQDVEVWELVPDDIVVLAVGDKVPADGILLESTRVAVDEAVLTGESEPVTKHADANMFMGSAMVTGRGILRVTAIGSVTELGKIAMSLASPTEEETPLQVRLRSFSRTLTKLVIATTAAILVIGVAVGQPFLEMLRTAIVLAVAAIPEGLIIAVTVILVIGMRRVLRREGLVKRLLAVEALGSVTTICTDKTGTLTEGRMRVTVAALTDQVRALDVMVLCNDLEGPVDIALWEYAEQHLGEDPQGIVDMAPRMAEELFTSETKYMIASVTNNALAGAEVFLLKGAPEVVLDMCDVTDDDRLGIARTIDEWADQGLRLLGLADRNGGHLSQYSGYRWLGVIGMEDPVRDGVVEAVTVARRAGIRVLMITGDYRRTAESIARSIGIPISGVLDGEALTTMTDDELRREVCHCSVFARIRPQDKLRIVQALAANGEITAMIGDGVNDAPALKAANIGVVVGSATDVAKETADLILLDNNFRTIVSCVEEGRVIFDNLRKVVAYVLSNSFAEVLTIFLAIMLGWPAPLSVAQILWIHLICDGPEDIVLGFEPKEDGIMEQPPRSIGVSILDRLGFTLIALISGLSAMFGLSVFGYYHLVRDDAVRGSSIIFATFALSSVLYIVAFRSLRQPIWRMKSIMLNRPLLASMGLGITLSVLPFFISPLGRVLNVVPLQAHEWALIIGWAIALTFITEVVKALLPQAKSELIR